MNEKELQRLLERYQQGLCDPEEKTRVERWYAEKVQDSLSSTFLSNQQIEQDLAEIKQKLPHNTPQPVALWPFYRVSIAAAIILAFISLGIFIYIQNHPLPPAKVSMQDFTPGRNAAQLNLANGQSLNLENVAIGKTYQLDGVELHKKEDGEISYMLAQEQHVAGSWNEMVIPRGGQFKIVLEDGTNVWLNAASKLRFPTAFGDDIRVVEVEGEAYFEVTEDQRRPFRVKTNQQTITVLGTSFNVKGYPDEPHMTTTLLTGSVKIADNRQPETYTLTPGQQIRLEEDGSAKIFNVDPSDALAWKEGLFKFDGIGIEEALRQFARWYDVDIQYEGEIPSAELFGETSRKENARQALEMLSFFGLRYQIVNDGQTRAINIHKK